MRGLSPVITTVLLLLMAIAAVGGAWVWYQRMQQQAMSGGSGQVGKYAQQAGIILAIDKLQPNATGTATKLVLANQGTEDAKVTTVELYFDNGTLIKTVSTSTTVSANGFATIMIDGYKCTSGDTYKVTVYSGANKLLDKYPATCE